MSVGSFTFSCILICLNFFFFFFLADVRAIVLEHGNPSMKSQMKALAAAESKFLFMYITIFYF